MITKIKMGTNAGQKCCARLWLKGKRPGTMQWYRLSANLTFPYGIGH